MGLKPHQQSLTTLLIKMATVVGVTTSLTVLRRVGKTRLPNLSTGLSRLNATALLCFSKLQDKTMNTLLFFYILGVVIWLYKAGKYDAEAKIETATEALALVGICFLWPAFTVYLMGYISQRNEPKEEMK